MKEAFVNPNAFGLAAVGNAAHHAALDVLAEGELFRYRSDGLTSWNTRLERQFAAWFEAEGSPSSPHAVAVANGTSGLTVALRAIGIGPGDRVLVPAFTFIATAMAVVAVGAVPEPFDVGPCLGIDLDDLSERLHAGVRALVGVHVQGHAADLRSVPELLRPRGIPIIEDACQGFGATCGDVAAGAVGHISAFSFQQAKQLASGEGGMLLIRDDSLAATCRRLVDLGALRDERGNPSWDHPEATFGQNLRMTELQAAVLVQQLAAARDTIRRQRQLRVAVRDLIESQGITTLRSTDPDGDTGSHLLLPVDRPESAETAIHTAAQRSVLVRRVWDRTYYQHGVFERAGLTPQALGVRPASRAENLAPRLLSVPIPPTLAASQVETVADAVTAAVRGRQDTVPR